MKTTQVAPEIKSPESPESVGRKKKPAAERKSIALRVLVTREQRKALEKAARAGGLELSTWIRTVALEVANRGRS